MDDKRYLVARILKDALPEDQIGQLLADVDAMANARLASIGVDSLAFFSVISNLEEICGEPLDYGVVDFEALNSINGILAYIGKHVDAD